MHANKVESHPFSQLFRATGGTAGFGTSKTNGWHRCHWFLQVVVNPELRIFIVYVFITCVAGSCRSDDQWCQQG